MILKNFEKKEKSLAVFTVESDAAEFEKAVQSVYLKSKKNIYVPGFRKGKAPRQIIEGMYGREVFYQDAADELAPDAYDFARKEKELRVVGQPSITNFRITDDRTAEFTFSAPVYPEVTLGQYKGIEAYRPERTATDEDVDAEIESVRKRNARMVNVDRAAEMGDTVTIDFEGFLNGEPFEGGKGEDHRLELGSNSFVPGFEVQLVGMSAGDEKDIDIVFPADYTPELAGKAVVFHVAVNEVSTPEYPELDDEFAQDVSDFDTLEEYRADVRSTIQKRMDDSAESAFRDEIVRKAVEGMTADIPDAMVEEKIDEFLNNYAMQFGMYERDMSRQEIMKLLGLNEDALNYSIRPGSVHQVKTEVLLEAVADAEGIAPTEEELEEFCKKQAENMGASAEDIKRYFGNEYLTEQFKREKAMDLMAEAAVKLDKPEAPAAAEPEKEEAAPAAEAAEAEAPEKTAEAPAAEET